MTLQNFKQNEQNEKRPSMLAFLLFLGVLGMLAFDVLRGLIYPLIWAAVIAFLTRPVYLFFDRKFFIKKKRPALCAAVTLFCAILFLLLPFLYFLGTLAKEAASLPHLDVSSAVSAVSEYGRSFIQSASNFFGGDGSATTKEAFERDAQEAIKVGIDKIGAWLLATLQAATSTVAGFILDMFVTLFAAFFFIRDWDALSEGGKRFIPLAEADKEQFLLRGKSLLQSVLAGVVLTVAVQALLGAVGWYFAGLPSAAFFGFMMFITGMIPIVGTALVWVPGALYLLAVGDTLHGGALLAWGALVVGTVDQFLRPLLISSTGKQGDYKIHTLLVLIGILGGMSAWGFLGIFLGPVILSLFLLVFDTWQRCW